MFATVRREEIGDVVIIDCDKNYVESPYNDVSEMPHDIVSYLKKQLTNSSADLRGNKIPKIFLSSLVQIIGGYRDAIKYNDVRLKFDNELFIESQSPSNRGFVQKIVELQIFQQFVEERLKLMQNGGEMSDEFELEVELHAERMGKKSNQYKEFIRNLRGRANPAMKNAVKSVKAIGKELKLKIKDNNSHKSPNYISKTRPVPEPFTTFAQFYPSVSNTLIDSPSTSSSQSSTSDMNILQELEAHPAFKQNGSQVSSQTTTPSQKPKNECNLIDLSDSIDSIQFDPLESDDRKFTGNLSSNSKFRDSGFRDASFRDPFGSSELLKDVVEELNRSTSTVASTPSNWTKFE